MVVLILDLQRCMGVFKCLTRIFGDKTTTEILKYICRIFIKIKEFKIYTYNIIKETNGSSPSSTESTCLAFLQISNVCSPPQIHTKYSKCCFQLTTHHHQFISLWTIRTSGKYSTSIFYLTMVGKKSLKLDGNQIPLFILDLLERLKQYLGKRSFKIITVSLTLSMLWYVFRNEHICFFANNLEKIFQDTIEFFNIQSADILIDIWWNADK